jgi:hypothetical protein
MTTTNPYADEPERAEVFELGYIAGFQDPDGADFLPLSPELLDIYQQGIDNGRDDAAQSPTPWVPRSELESESSDEWVEHITIEVVAEVASHLFKRAALGLIGVLITVVQIPGDTQLHPLEDDGLSEPYSGADDDPNVTYLAMCSRTDHPIPAEGTTTEGYWTGSAVNDFGAALREALDHGHREAIVARCSLTDNNCGPVWAAVAQ